VIPNWLDLDRVAITGPPKSGKTTLSGLVTDRPVFHTDDWIDLPWKDIPVAILGATQHLDRFVVEGIQVPRAIKRGLEVDVILVLDEPYIPLSKAQWGLWNNVKETLYTSSLVGIVHHLHSATGNGDHQ